MATSLRMKRMLRERPSLEKPSDDFFVFFENDDDLFTLHAYVLGPADTLYAYKLIKLKIEIPERYPLCPPKCTFIQHSGGRIHPNLYVDGKVCLSILGTWTGEPWALAMSVETVLITVRSLLDNAPYKHEPGQRDNEEFNKYVQYTTWKVLLIDYVQKETNPSAIVFLQRHFNKNGQDMIKEFEKQTQANSGRKTLISPYISSSQTAVPTIDFASLQKGLENIISDCKTAEAAREIKFSNVDSTEPKAMVIRDVPETENATENGHNKKTKISESSSILSLPITKPVNSNPCIDKTISKVEVKVTTPMTTKAEGRSQDSTLKRKHEVIDLT